MAEAGKRSRQDDAVLVGSAKKAVRRLSGRWRHGRGVRGSASWRVRSGVEDDRLAGRNRAGCGHGAVVPTERHGARKLGRGQRRTGGGVCGGGGWEWVGSVRRSPS